MSDTRQRRITRRELGGGLLAAAGIAAGAPALLRAQNLNSTLDIAITGAGGRGQANMKGVASENITALCDVDAAALDRIGAAHPKARKVTDFRRLFDNPRDFDAVVVSTCEHTHVFATMLALKARRHVYCEKPLTHNIWEARLVRETAATVKVATQMGNQGHCIRQPPAREGADTGRRDRFGPRGPRVGQPRVGPSEQRGRGAEQGRRVRDGTAGGGRAGAARLDWDLWRGPAPARPFHSVYVPGPKWYRWWDFGNGTMSDLGNHSNDITFYALGIRAPLTVEASPGLAHPEIAPARDDR